MTPAKKLSKVGTGPVRVITIAPTTQSQSASGDSYTFGPVTVTVQNGTPTAYNWRFVLPSGGSFSIISGQGAATATPRVTFVTDSASASLVCDVTVGGVVYESDNSCFLSYNNTGGGGPPPL